MADLPSREPREQLEAWLTGQTASRSAGFRYRAQDLFNDLTDMSRGSVLDPSSYIQWRLDTSPQALMRLFNGQTGLVAIRTSLDLGITTNEAKALAPYQRSLSKKKGLWVVL